MVITVANSSAPVTMSATCQQYVSMAATCHYVSNMSPTYQQHVSNMSANFQRISSTMSAKNVECARHTVMPPAHNKSARFADEARIKRNRGAVITVVKSRYVSKKNNVCKM